MMHRWRIALVYTAICLIAVRLPAESQFTTPEKITGVVGLDELLILTERHNPELAAARRRVEASEGRTRQSGLWPNPNLEYQEEGLDAFDEGTSRVTLGQPIAIGGRLAKARAAATAERLSREQELRGERHRLYGEVHRVWVRILYLQDAYDLQWRLIGLAQQTEMVMEERSDAGARRAALDTGLLRTGLLAIITDRSVTMLTLQRLIGGTRVGISQVTGKLESALDPAEMALSIDDTVEDHPDRLAMDRAVDAADAEIELARREWIPDPILKGIAGNDRDRDESFVGAGIEIPIPLFDRNQGRIDERLAERYESEDRLAAVDLHLREDIARLLMLLNELDTIVADYRTEYVPAAEEVYTAARESFAAGETDALDLLDAQRTLVTIKRQELDYIYQMNDALAQLRHFRLYAPVMR